MAEPARKSTAARADSVASFLHLHRNSLGPPALAAGLWVLASALHATGVWDGWAWWDLRWLGVALAVVYLAIGLQAVSTLPSRVEKAIAAPGWVLACAWFGVGSWWVAPWSRPMLAVLVAGLIGFGAAWAWHRRVRRGVEVDRAIPAWGDGSAVGLAGTTARGTKAGTDWFSYRVKANEAGRYTVDSYKQVRKRIAARFGVRAEAVSFRELDTEGEVEVTIREGARETVAYEKSEGVLSIVGPHTVGTTDDAGPLQIVMYLAGGDGGRAGAQHAGITGDTGSGKSGLVNRAAEIVVRAEDALLWIIDLSFGSQELRAWRPACDAWADTPEKAELMIRAAVAISEDRGRRSNSRVHQPTPAEPAIVVLCDEQASLFAPELLPADSEVKDRMEARRKAQLRAKHFETGVRNFRKHGVGWWGATQYGDAAALGTPAAKQQLVNGHAAVFYAAKDQTGHLVIPARLGVRSSELPPNRPGTLFLKSPAMDGIRKGRVEWMDDDEIAECAAEWAPQQPQLEAAAVRAAGVDYDQIRQQPGGASPPRPRKTPAGEDGPKRMSPEESRQLVWDTLAGLGKAQVGQVAEACDKSVPLVRGRLTELADEGRVRRVGTGRWTRYEVVS